MTLSATTAKPFEAAPGQAIPVCCLWQAFVRSSPETGNR